MNGRTALRLCACLCLCLCLCVFVSPVVADLSSQTDTGGRVSIGKQSPSHVSCLDRATMMT